VREEGRWIVNGEVYDAVIATIAPGILKSLGLDTPEIPYQGAACLTLGLVRPVTRGIYWINLYDQAPYGAVIAHTCFAPRSWYGEDIVYLASYYTQPPSPDLKDRMIDDFCQKFSVMRDEIVWAEMAQDPYAGPLYVAGYRDLVRTISVPAITLAGMFSVENYPERSIEGSVRAGLRAAREVEQLHLPWGRSL